MLNAESSSNECLKLKESSSRFIFLGVSFRFCNSALGGEDVQMCGAGQGRAGRGGARQGRAVRAEETRCSSSADKFRRVFPFPVA